MELPKVTFEELLVARQYLIVCYRAGNPCSFQIYDGQTIGYNKDYFVDGQDYNGATLTYEFFLLPQTVR